MFRRKEILVPIPIERTRTEYVDRSVTINRAPTDESVRLLREMEAAAAAKVLEAVKVGNSVFECVIHRALDALSDCVQWRAIFKLNGKQMVADVETDRRHSEPSDVAAKLCDEMAKVIATEIFDAAFVDLMRQCARQPLPRAE